MRYVLFGLPTSGPICCTRCAHCQALPRLHAGPASKEGETLRLMSQHAIAKTPVLLCFIPFFRSAAPLIGCGFRPTPPCVGGAGDAARLERWMEDETLVTCVQVHCGPNTFVAKDFTVHAKMEGTVRFYKKKGPKTSIMHVTVDETTVPEYDKSASTRRNAKLAKYVSSGCRPLRRPRRRSSRTLHHTP